jgi:hypothetical protein
LIEESVEGWQFSQAVQGRLRRDGAVVALTIKKSLVAGYSPGSNDLSAGSSRISTVRSHCQGMAVEGAAEWKKA